MARPKVNPPRPPNSYILFRKHISEQLFNTTEDKPKMTQGEISTLTSKLWRTIPPGVKQYFESQSREAIQEHKKAHPQYRYRPRRKKSQQKQDSQNTRTVPWWYDFYRKSSPGEDAASPSDQGVDATVPASIAPPSWQARGGEHPSSLTSSPYPPLVPVPIYWLPVPASAANTSTSSPFAGQPQAFAAQESQVPYPLVAWYFPIPTNVSSASTSATMGLGVAPETAADERGDSKCGLSDLGVDGDSKFSASLSEAGEEGSHLSESDADSVMEEFFDFSEFQGEGESDK